LGAILGRDLAQQNTSWETPVVNDSLYTKNTLSYIILVKVLAKDYKTHGVIFFACETMVWQYSPKAMKT